MEHGCPSCAMSDSLPTQLELAGWVEGSVQEERRVVVLWFIPKNRKEEGSSAVCNTAVQCSTFCSLKFCPGQLGHLPLPWLLSAFPLLCSLRYWPDAISGTKVETARKDEIFFNFSASGAGTQNLT